jgi:hypothetical protein
MKIDLQTSLKRTVSHLKKEIFTANLKRRALVFSFENAKLKDTYTFSLPSGWTCPGAEKCLAKADKLTGKLWNGPGQVYRCFSASQEAIYPTVRDIRWHNFELLKQAGNMASMESLILESLPADAKVIRIHVAGDFFSQAYFDAWLNVAYQRPEVIFYAYTKSVNFWVGRQTFIPDNFKLNASMGGRHDNLAELHGLKSVYVVLNETEAADLGLEVDEDDTHAWKQDESFAIVVHGTQPPGSEASKAWTAQLKEMRLEPKREVKHRLPATIEYLTAQIVRLASRLAAILLTPEYVVVRL